MIRASFYEQPGAPAQLVTLQVMAGMLWIKSGEVIQRRAALTDLKIAPLRGTAYQLTLPDGTWCEVAEQPALTQLLEELKGETVRMSPPPRSSLVQNLAGAMVTSLFVVAAAIVAAFVWGLPRVASRIALDTPAPARVQISQRIVAALDADGTLAPSTLPVARRRQIEQDYAALTLEAAAHPLLLFRASPALGAGVLTLPDGSLVLLDRSEQLMRNGQQLMALLAHSLGHARGSEILRLMYQQAPLQTARSWWAKEDSELRALAPRLLLEVRYPHEREHEADIYAVGVLRASGIAPSRLAEALELLLAAERDEGSGSGTQIYMDVHPATDLRARALRNGNF